MLTELKCVASLKEDVNSCWLILKFLNQKFVFLKVITKSTSLKKIYFGAHFVSGHSVDCSGCNYT